MTRLAALALLGFAFVLPWEDSLVLPFLGSIGRVSGLVLMVAALPALFVQGRLRLRYPSVFLVLMALFMLWSSLSLYWSQDPANTFAHVITRLQLLVLAYLVWQLMETPLHALGAMRAYVLGCYVAVGSAAYNFVSGSEATWQRYSAAGTDPNEFATMIALGIPMAWLLVHREKRTLWFWPLLLYLPVALGAVVLTSSRGGALVTIVALLVVPMTLHALKARRRVAFWALAAVGMVGMLQFAPQISQFASTSINRLLSTVSEVTEGTLNERALIWDAGFRVYEQNPLLGVGAGGFEKSVASIIGFERVAHNTYISVFVETGPVGLVLFGAALLAALASVWRNPPVERAVLLVLLMTLLVGIIPLTWEYRKVTWFVLVLATAFGTTVIGKPARA